MSCLKAWRHLRIEAHFMAVLGLANVMSIPHLLCWRDVPEQRQALSSKSFPHLVCLGMPFSPVALLCDDAVPVDAWHLQQQLDLLLSCRKA